MADTNVVVQMSAQDADLVAAWQRARQGPAGMAQELDKVKKKGKEAGDSIQGSFTNTAKSLIGVGSAAGLVLKTSQLIQAEWIAIKQRMDEAANRQIDVNQSFRRAAAVSTDISPDKLYEQVVSGANGVDPRELFLAIEAGISASGNIPQQSVVNTTMASAKIAPYFDQESRTAAVTGALTWQKAFKVKPEEALAGIMQSFVAARTEQPAEFAANLAPAVSNLRALGGDKDSFKFLMSELIAFGQRSGDKQGRKTATNYISLARQYKEEAVAAGLVDKDASLEESLSAVRGNPAIQQKMLGVFADKLEMTPAQALMVMRERNKDAGGALSLEQRTWVAGKETLQANQGATNLTAEERRAANDKLLGLTPAAVEAIDSRNKVVEGSKYSAAAGIARAGKQSTAIAELLNTPAAIKSEASKEYFNALRKTGVGSLKRSALSVLDMANLMTAPDSEEGAAAAIRPYSQGLESQISSERIFGGGTEASNLNIRVLETALEKINETLKRLEDNNSKPQNVKIVGDNRPVQPQSTPNAGLSDE